MKTALGYHQLLEAVDQGILTREQAEQLWTFLQKKGTNGYSPADQTDTPVSKFFYYLGALIVIGAMGWFMNNTWERFGGFGLFAIAAIYAGCFIWSGRYFRSRSATLSGLLYIMAVGMTPLAVYGLQKGLGLWPYGYPGGYPNFHVYIKSGWFTIETATLCASLLALRYARIPFATAPVAFTLWYMSMDVTPILYGPRWDMEAYKQISVIFGLIMLACAFTVDRRAKIDYAKWLYIFGCLVFWTGLSLMNAHSEFTRFLYCLLNACLILAGTLLERKAFVVFGGLGVFGYIGHLAWSVFRDSLMFPFALSGVGLTLIYAGWLYHQRQDRILRFIHAVTPDWVIRNLPQNRTAVK